MGHFYCETAVRHRKDVYNDEMGNFDFMFYFICDMDFSPFFLFCSLSILLCSS